MGSPVSGATVTLTDASHSDRKMGATAPSRRIEERTTAELYQCSPTFLHSLRALKAGLGVVVDVSSDLIHERAAGVVAFPGG